MKITYFLVDKKIPHQDIDRPILIMRRVSVYELSSDFHPNLIKEQYKSIFLDIEIEDHSELRENNEILFIADVLNIKYTLLEEIITDQRPRMETYSDFIFILYKSINKEEEDPYTKKEFQVGLLIFKNVVICIHFDKPVAMDTLYRYFDRNQRFLIEGGSTYLFSTYLDCLTDPIFAVLHDWRGIIKNIEMTILQTPRKELLHNISDLKSSLMDLDYILRADKEVISKIYSLRNRIAINFIPPELDDHIVHCLDEARILLRILSMLMDIYYSIDSFNLNRSLARLTIITAIFLFPTLIADIFGMNNQGFPQIHFFWVVGFIVFIMIATYIYFKKKLKLGG